MNKQPQKTMPEKDTIRLVYSIHDWGSEDATPTENERLTELLSERLRETVPEYEWRVIAADADTDPNLYQPSRLITYETDDLPLSVLEYQIEEAWSWALQNMDAWENPVVKS